MAIVRLTAADFATQLQQAILSRNANYDTQLGPIPDLVINPLSGVLELQNERIRSVQQLLSLINDGSFSDSDLNNFVYNELLIRLGGSPSNVTLIFSVATPPTVNLTVAANFPVATLPDEVTGQSITFLTIAAATLDSSNIGQYFNSATQRYELQVGAQAVTSATSANVAPNRVVRALRPLTGFDSVFNRNAAVAGQDQETNNALIDRYFLSLLGTSPSVVDGIQKILRDQFPIVLGSNLVFGNNPANVRSASDGGAVDVYVIGSTPATFTESIVFSGVSQLIPLTYQPIINIVSAGSYIQGTDFILVKDISGNAGSPRAEDSIQWLPTGSFPAIGSAVQVTYNYDSLMTSLQSAFTTPAYNSPSRDILFKEAKATEVTCSAQIKVLSGFNVATVLSAVQTAILALVNNNALGITVEGSNIQQVARSFSSVSNFIITNLALAGQIGTADIPMGPNQYSTMNSSDLVLTVI